jgi:hypothetical protein
LSSPRRSKQELSNKNNAITITGKAVAILGMAVTTEVAEARADYGCVTTSGTNATSGSELCLERPTTDNIWKSRDGLNATGSLHGSGIVYVFMNQTVIVKKTITI